MPLVFGRGLYLDAMSYPELPEPWEVAEYLDQMDADALESVVGSGLSDADMTTDDVTDEQFPKSLRGYWVKGHKWVRLYNRETGDDMIVRLQYRGPVASEAYVSAVISPFQDGSETTGAQLRALPVSAISAAWTAHEMKGTINLNRTLALGAAYKSDPMERLPRGRVTDQAFLAKVGRQYDAIAERHPGDDPVQRMMAINGVALSTVQKWLTAARKSMMLMPVAAGRKRG